MRRSWFALPIFIAPLCACSPRGSSGLGTSDAAAGASDTAASGTEDLGVPPPIEGTAGTAPPDSVAFEGTLAGAAPGFTEGSLVVGGRTRTVGLYVPEGLPAHPPLIVALHGTGSNPADFLDELGLRHLAEESKVLVVAPQAMERNGGRGERGDPDHYAGADGFWGTSWNLGEDDPETNDDLLLVRAIIADARASYGVDSDRVYTFGHSNGAFFAYHAAATLSDRVAGFAENAGGAVRCENKGPDGAQFVGSATSCEELSAAAGFPSCAGPLSPVEPDVAGRIPWGFLAHHNDDDVVSVAWTCQLAAALGARGETFIKAPDGDSAGHSVVTDFPRRAWASLSGRTRTN